MGFIALKLYVLAFYPLYDVHALPYDVSFTGGGLDGAERCRRSGLWRPWPCLVALGIGGSAAAAFLGSAVGQLLEVLDGGFGLEAALKGTGRWD